MTSFTLSGARIFDGQEWHDGKSLVVRNGMVDGIADSPPSGVEVRSVSGLLVPGFVDLQVNGGGGLMINDKPEVGSIRTICAAHAPFGTTSLLVTLITDRPDVTAATVRAGADALDQQVPGFLGLHLEGPHLSVARKGAHDPALIRPMLDADLATILAARRRVPVLLVTVAPESVTPEQITTLADAGVVVSLGHTDARYATAVTCIEAGASMATHLFNAMSQLGNREPGTVGAVLDTGVSAGLIADGIHVDPATIGVALRAKHGPGRVFLVTDAMATIGTDMTSFELNGRTIHRRDGRLTLADGTLAGADLDMISAVRFMHRSVGLDLAEAIRMATVYPAEAMGVAERVGILAKGAQADIVNLSGDLDIQGVWIGGERRV